MLGRPPLLLQAEERRQSKASKGERPVVSIDNPVWQAIRWGTQVPPSLQPGQAMVLGLPHASTSHGRAKVHHGELLSNGVSSVCCLLRRLPCQSPCSTAPQPCACFRPNPTPRTSPLLPEPWDLDSTTRRKEAQEDAGSEPILSSFLYASILSHTTFEQALAFVLANRLSDATMLATELLEVLFCPQGPGTIRQCPPMP